MKWSIEEFGDRRCSILVLALWLYHRGLLSDSIPAGELTGEEFGEQHSFPNKSHEHERGQVFLSQVENRELCFFLWLPVPAAHFGNWPRLLPIKPFPVCTVNHLIDSYSWAFYSIQLCGSKKTSPSWLVKAFHSNRPRTRPKKEAALPLDLHSLFITLSSTFPNILPK